MPTPLAFKLARQILADGNFERFVADRYSSFDTGYGKRHREAPQDRLQASLNKLVLTKLGEPTPRSGKSGVPRKPPQYLPPRLTLRKNSARWSIFSRNGREFSANKANAPANRGGNAPR
jgi:hypothetical protein